MKIQITKEAKRYLTLAEMPEVKKMVSDLKEERIEDYAPIAARIASGRNDPFELLKAEAEISRNQRIDNGYHDGSGNLDVWMRFYFYNSTFGFYEVGVYLTDLWQSTGENAEEIKQYMYINGFTNA